MSDELTYEQHQTAKPKDLMHASYMSGVHNGEMAIKARRCTACTWYDKGYCLHEGSFITEPQDHSRMKDFSCSLWEPKCNQ